eukprot:gnl/TRDRNA2_/TRDRNA2_203447_c0_seq1.p1 gnl/TRDRNA2_/TRDRNA2_203447_c0~~gnl/TRDRNA2_/TRDRNA2_203447_c0_seq1.p1  ORF type:complete len:140 (-),score=29.36 gnl/TRDRNA2_/TRDRNA2_203447_c0_seq1:170-589(-)
MRSFMIFLYQCSLLILAMSLHVPRMINFFDEPEKPISFHDDGRGTDLSDLWKRVKEAEEEAEHIIAGTLTTGGRWLQELQWIQEIFSERSENKPKSDGEDVLSLAQAGAAALNEDKEIMTRASEVADLTLDLLSKKLEL